jgi:hypothetical protein
MNVILTVHGVGASAVAETITLLGWLIGNDRKNLTLGNPPTDYARTIPRTVPKVRELAEMNWSDVQMPRQSFFGFMRHIPALAFALLRVDYKWLNHPGEPTLRNLYRAFLEGFACRAVFQR